MTASKDDQKVVQKPVSDLSKNISLPTLENIERRTVIRKLAVGTAALAGCSLLPAKWTRPILEFGALPAHATTSGTSSAAAQPAPTGVCTTEFNLIFLMTYSVAF